MTIIINILGASRGYIIFYVHVIYVTWAGVICLICTHEHKASADISGKS